MHSKFSLETFMKWCRVEVNLEDKMGHIGGTVVLKWEIIRDEILILCFVIQVHVTNIVLYI